MGWDWLTNFTYSWRFALRVILKAALLFIVINVLFALINPIPTLGNISLYNTVITGRDRLPYGEVPASYNLSLSSLEAMFASHSVSTAKPSDEYRVLVLGDSAVWGILLDNPDTLAGYLTAAQLQANGRVVRAYNIGHPIMSVTKDLMLLDYAMRYQPDMILWLVTLESLPYSEQLEPPLLINNPERVHALIETYQLPLDPANVPNNSDFLGQTLVGQRRAIADWLRLQVYGFAWNSTGIDQVYGDYTPRSNDFQLDDTWKTFSASTPFTADDLAFEVLDAGHTLAATVPMIIINEPIYIAAGENSDIRYNFWYPRWGYDEYRQLFQAHADQNNWHYLDLWDVIAPQEFTDSPVHLTPQGSRRLSELISEVIIEIAN